MQKKTNKQTKHNIVPTKKKHKKNPMIYDMHIKDIYIYLNPSAYPCNFTQTKNF